MDYEHIFDQLDIDPEVLLQNVLDHQAIAAGRGRAEDLQFGEALAAGEAGIRQHLLRRLGIEPLF